MADIADAADTEEKGRKAKFNQQNLHQEEVFTDLTVGSIRRLTPVKPNGEPDKTRPVLFVGQAQIYTQQGPMPVQFPIDAKNLQLAMEKFPDGDGGVRGAPGRTGQRDCSGRSSPG